MASLPDLFVTPHAVAQFQSRIAPLEKSAALRVIREGVSEATNVRTLPDGKTWRIQTRRPFSYEFRAFCVLDDKRRHPVLVTILRGDSGVTRKQKRKSAQNWDKTKAERQLRSSGLEANHDE